MTPSSMRPEVCPARTEACLPESPALGAGLMTPPSTRPEVCPARTEPRPPDTGRPPDERPAAYVVRCACAPGLDGTRGGTVVDHVRLFPLRPGVRLTYRVHEQILPSLKRAKIPVRWTDLIVQHRGVWAGHKRDRRLMRMLGKSVPPDTGCGRKSLAALEINDAAPPKACQLVPNSANVGRIRDAHRRSTYPSSPRDRGEGLPFFLAK